jgi:hypothetical protein
MLESSERRSNLRRLHDILEVLEQLNLNDRTELPRPVADSLVGIGVDNPYHFTIPQLIEKVWAQQQPFLITLVTDRRRRRRRSADIDATASTTSPPSPA